MVWRPKKRDMRPARVRLVEWREEVLDASVYLTWKIMQDESAQRKMGGE